MSAEGGAEGGSASTKRTKRKQKRGNAIRLALLAGDVAGLDRAVQEGARVDAQLEGGRTPLTLACDSGSVALVAKLCALGADVNLIDKHGENPLVKAMRAGSVACVAELLSWGASPRVEVRAGIVSPACLKLVTECATNGPLLLEAARYGELPRVMELAALGPHVANYKDDEGWTALHGACFSDEAAPQMIRVLVTNGARLDACTVHGYSPLIEACATDKLAACTALLECGSNVNATDADGWTALHFACAEARVEIAQVLLLHGARPSSVTRDGRLPRDVCNSEGILTLLKRREEEDLRLRRQRMMETALSAAEQREAEERAAQMRDLEARVTRAESMLSESLRENEVLRDTVAQLAEGLPSDLLAMLSEQAAKTSGAGEAQQDVAGTADAAAADKASGSGEVEAAAAPSGSAETVLLQEVRRLSCLVQRARSFGTGPVQMFEESTLDEVLLQPQAFERTDEVVWESPYSRIAEGRAVGGRAVVLKRIKLAESARAAVQHVVFDDVALCRTLRHPNLVVFVGVCLAPHLELAFASVSGPSLHVLLHGPEARDLPLRAKYRIMRGICNGFVYLHERCVFHQRFSSFHVLLSEGGEPRLCGFAMPHTMLAVRGPRPQGQWRRWCSPEVAAAPAGELSMWMNSEKPDVYSFGMVCWELCSELEPFGDVKSDDAVVERIARGEQAFSDDAFKAMVPELFAPMISACLSVPPTARPSFAGCRSFLLSVIQQLPPLLKNLDDASRYRLRKDVDLLRVAAETVERWNPMTSTQAVELRSQWDAALAARADELVLRALEAGVSLPNVNVVAMDFAKLARNAVSPTEMFELDDVVRDPTFAPLRLHHDGRHMLVVDESDPILVNMAADFGPDVKNEVVRMLAATVPVRLGDGHSEAVVCDQSGIVVKRSPMCSNGLSVTEVILHLARQLLPSERAQQRRAPLEWAFPGHVNPYDSHAVAEGSGCDGCAGKAESGAAETEKAGAVAVVPDVTKLRSDGKQHMLDGNYKEAVECFTAAIVIEGHVPALHAHRSAAFFAAGRYRAALEDCNTAIMGGNAAPSLVLRKADSLTRLGRFEAAEAALKTVVGEDVSDRLASLQRARTIASVAQLLFERERFQEVLKHVTEAMAVAPLADELLILQGRALLALNEPQLAACSADAVLQKNPECPGAWWVRGAVAYGDGQLDEAARCFEQVETENDDDVPSGYVGAVAPLSAPLAYALDFGQKACRVYALSCQAIHQIDCGASEEAVALLDEALAIGSNSPLVVAQLQFGRGIAFNALGRLREAFDALSQALEIEPDFFEALVERAKSSEAMGDMETSKLHPTEQEVAAMNMLWQQQQQREDDSEEWDDTSVKPA